MLTGKFLISENADHLAMPGCIGNAHVLALRMGAIRQDHQGRQRVGFYKKRYILYVINLRIDGAQRL